MSSNDPLLQPFRIKQLGLRNRVMSTSHEPAYSEEGLPKDRYRAYHVEKAKGGIALTMIGGSTLVAPDSPPAFGNLCAWKDEIVPWLARLSEEVHAHGAAVMIQLTHLGRRSGWNKGDWLPLVAPSCVREPAHRAFPKVAEDFDLRRIVCAYADAAERCRAGGMDGIELEAYGHLLDAFWSPAWNRRDDEYGVQSLDNRLRFALQVLAAIRARVGTEFPIGMRMVVDENLEGGLTRADGMAIAHRLVNEGGVDFINVIKGHIESDAALADVIPLMGTPAAPHLPLVREVKEALGVPVLHAARINDVATARHAVASGALDMVGMTRAHMADPHIVAKIERGEEQRIRPCVGAGYCIDRIYEGGEALCLHNAATGRELSMPQAVTRGAGPVRKVVVVGAGVAGLEAARVSAARGHRVVLFEAAREAGGQLRLAAAPARRRELLGIAGWLVQECGHHGVDMRFNRYVEAEEVLAETPDDVVIATGGIPNTAIVERGEELLTTTWDILSGQVAAGREVLLFDDNAGHPGPTCAEFMTAAGAHIEFVTPERGFAPDIGGLNYPAYLRAFFAHGVTITLGQRLRAVVRDGNRLTAQLWNEYTRETVTRDVDQVVVEHGTLPADELYFALKPRSRNLGEVDVDALIAGRPQALVTNPDGSFRLFRIGDAVASRNVHAAIYDALRLCNTL